MAGTVVAAAARGRANCAPSDRHIVSVINRMLQDIDRRQAAADLAASATHPDIQRVKPRVEAAATATGLGWKFALLVGSVALVLWVVGLWRAPSPISPTLPTAPSVAAQAAPLPSSTPAQAGPPGPAVAMDSATAVLVAAAYLVALALFVRHMRARSAPYDVKWLAAVHNANLLALSAYMAYGIVREARVLRR